MSKGELPRPFRTLKNAYAAMRYHSFIFLVIVGMALVGPHHASAYVPAGMPFRTFAKKQNAGFALKAGTDDSTDKDDSFEQDGVESDRSFLEQRLKEMRVGIMEQELQRPPNPALSACEFVTQVLDGLRNPYDPLPDSGFRLLLRASTPKWRKTIHRSIGAPTDANEEVVASALGTAIGRPKNQFGILVGAEDAEEYTINFPTEAIDYDDGTCWMECQLRSKEEDTLLVVMGWSLQKRPSDGAWLVDRIDWQDFRDRYRPGIGREEWERICG